MSGSAIEKSVDLDAHLSALKQIPKLIETSILRETKPDRDGKPEIREIQRFYGLIEYNGEKYPVKITVKAYTLGNNNAYSYEVMEIESPEKGAGTPAVLKTSSEDTALPDDSITPQQKALLARPNFSQYQSVEELSADKGTENIPNEQETGEKKPEIATATTKSAEQLAEEKALKSKTSTSHVRNRRSPSRSAFKSRLKAVENIEYTAYESTIEQEEWEAIEQESQETIDILSEPNVFAPFFEHFANITENISTFDEFLEFLEECKENGEFEESSFPFSPKNYIEIKKYINDARDAGYTYQQIRPRTESALSEGAGVHVSSDSERTTDRGDNGSESATDQTGSNNNDEARTRISTLTDLQQKEVRERTDDYDKKIEKAKTSLDSAIAIRDRELKKFSQANNFFREETELQGLFGQEGMTDVSSENSKRIYAKYQQQVDAARAEYNRLINDRDTAIEGFINDATKQPELDLDSSEKGDTFADDNSKTKDNGQRREGQDSETDDSGDQSKRLPVSEQLEGRDDESDIHGDSGVRRVQDAGISDRAESANPIGSDDRKWDDERGSLEGDGRKPDKASGESRVLGKSRLGELIKEIRQSGKKPTNEQIERIVSGVTAVDENGVVQITGEITDEIRDIVSQYTSGGIAKEGHGVIDPRVRLMRSGRRGATLTDVEHGKLTDVLLQTKLAKEVHMLESGEFMNTARRLSGKNLTDKSGTLYGFVTKDGVIYFDKSKLNANTPIHEFGHLFWNLMPAEMKAQITGLLKGTAEWQRIKNNPDYAHLKTDDEIADEVFNTILGDMAEGSQRVQEVIGKDITLMARIRNAINEFWKWVKALFSRNKDVKRDAKINQFAKWTLGELLSGRDLTGSESKKKSETRYNSHLEMARQSDYDFDVSGVTAANAREMKGIKEAAVASGTFMKAPNGKATKLNERQWLQVRTEGFKRWFGDWELANKLRMIEELVTIRANEKAATSEVESIYYDLGISEANSHDGRKIEFVRGVFGKLAGHRNHDLIFRTIPKLNDIFISAVPIYYEAERNPEKSTNIVGFQNYLGKVDIDGKEYYVRISAQELTPSRKRGEKVGKNEFHNAAVSDIELYEKSDPSVTTGLSTPATSTAIAFRDAKLQQFFESATLAKENSSKVTDENGEPLAVAHSTNKKFTIFENKQENDAGWLGAGYYFFGDRSLDGQYGKNIMDTFLNVKEPYYVSYDEARRLSELNDMDASRDFTDELINDGYDGVYFNGNLNQEYVVFNPNQIKSATDNNGNFDADSNDISFHFVVEKGAVALDGVEKATVRLDNLGISREMDMAFEDKKLRIDKLRKSETVQITGDEISPDDELKQYKKNALEYGKTLRGKYTNKDSGKEIELSRRGIQEVLRHDGGSIAHIQSIAAIPVIIENSIYIDTLENSDKEVNPNAASFDYYAVGLKIKGVDYTVKAVVINDRDGKRYYDHSLTQIEKGKLLDEVGGISSPTRQQEVSDRKDIRLFSILQTNDKENAKTIKLATGWERGADGEWRYEVPDIQTTNKFKNLKPGGTIRLENALEKDNELLKVYPFLKDLTIKIPKEKINGASINANADWIEISVYLPAYTKDGKESFNSDDIDEAYRSVLFHEIQHAIQKFEGFAQGAGYKKAELLKQVRNRISFLEEPLNFARNVSYKYGSKQWSDEIDRLRNLENKILDANKSELIDIYKRISGEVEARNVQARLNMFPEERRASLAVETEDVSREDQIFINQAFDGAQAYLDGENLENGGKSSIFADGYLQNIVDNARRIEEGKVVYERFSQAEQRGMSAGGSRHVEASLIAGRKVSARETQDERADRIEEEVEGYARSAGIWQDNAAKHLTELYGEPINSGQESLVYDNGETVVKT